ncbi:MAG TPA: hypothetical protein VFA11_02795 [Acidimicrobiales bacterium]|nr:hypothetical protein [Acidimicrobiales bacterium]
MRGRWAAAAAILSLAGLAAGAAGAGVGATPSAVTVQVDAAHPGPAVNEGLIGTNQPVAGAGPVISALGPAWGRADLSLDAGYNCATGTWDPTVADQRVQQDLAMGTEPEMIIDYSPPCMTSNPLHETLDPPDANGYAPWANLVEQAAFHEITTYGVRVFEVWNEPDGTFWHGTIADYLAMYQATAAAVEKAAARAGVTGVAVGGPALLFADPAWLEPFLAYVSANHLPLDFVSWHYYGNYPALGPFFTSGGTLPPSAPAPYWYNPGTRAQFYGVQVAQVRAELSRYPDLHPLTVIDEWNIDAGYDARSDGPYDAAFAAAVLDSVQSAGLDRMAFFRVADDSPHTLGNWGLLFSNLSPKPVYWTFWLWHQLAGAGLPVSLTPDQTTADPSGRVGAVASRSGAGAYNVLLYDFAPYDPSGGYGATDPNGFDHRVTVRWTALPKGPWTWSLRIVDASASADAVAATGKVGLGHAAVDVDLPGESVALLTLTPAS